MLCRIVLIALTCGVILIAVSTVGYCSGLYHVSDPITCAEPTARGAIPYHFSFDAGGWFRSPSLTWDDREIPLEITDLSADVIEGETGIVAFMPDPAKIDQCIGERSAGQSGDDAKSIWTWCQTHVAVSPEPVEIKLEILINRSTGVFRISRMQSKNRERYNTETLGSCALTATVNSGRKPH